MLDQTLRSKYLRKTKLSLWALTLAIPLLTGCSGSDPKNSSAAPGVDRNGISCAAGYTTIPTESAENLFVESSDKKIRTVTLKSAKTFSYDDSVYNFVQHCLSRKGNCEQNDHIHFEHGHSPKVISFSGNLIQLNKSDESKFDQISFQSFDSLNLKSNQGTSLTRRSILGPPSIDIKHAAADDRSYEYGDGSVFIGFLNRLKYYGEYQLLKVKVEKVVAGKEITFSYQLMAEVPRNEMISLYCSKMARLKNQAKDGDKGTVTLFHHSYGGQNASGFNFSYGITGIDTELVDTRPGISISSINKCGESKEPCVTFHIGSESDTWGGIVDLGDIPIDEVTMQKWPALHKVDPSTSRDAIKVNRTYLIQDLNGQTFTFGAIRPTKIDPDGRWVELEWKRVAIEKAYRFVDFTEVPISEAEATGEFTLSRVGELEHRFDIAFATKTEKTKPAYFVSHSNDLTASGSFEEYSGVAEVTGQFSSLNAIPKNTAEDLKGKFQKYAPIKLGGVYVVSTETLFMKASVAVQVIDFAPGQAVKLRYRRLYNGQTFPGQWQR